MIPNQWSKPLYFVFKCKLWSSGIVRSPSCSAMFLNVCNHFLWVEKLTEFLWTAQANQPLRVYFGVGWLWDASELRGPVNPCLSLSPLQPSRNTQPDAWGRTERGPQAPFCPPTQMTMCLILSPSLCSEVARPSCDAVSHAVSRALPVCLSDTLCVLLAYFIPFFEFPPSSATSHWHLKVSRHFSLRYLCWIRYKLYRSICPRV